MKIRVETADGRRFTVPLPLGLCKNPIMLNLLLIRAGNDADILQLKKLAPSAIRQLEEYTARYGHFNLAEIESADGNRVVIEV